MLKRLCEWSKVPFGGRPSMKKIIKRILRLRGSESGAATVLTAFFLGLFGLGFAALVIDASLLYAKRSEMVTSADAAALAGANYMREKLDNEYKTNPSKVISDAKVVALNFAKDNGAELDSSGGSLGVEDIFIGPKEVTIGGVKHTRAVIEVTLGVMEPSLFARFLGDEENLVEARAVATWGYVNKSLIGNILPMFAFDFQAKANASLFLHGLLKTKEEQLDPNNTNNYYLLNLFDSSSADIINNLLEGETVENIVIENNMLWGRGGQVSTISDSLKERMTKARTMTISGERREAMMGLVPVIDSNAFWTNPNNFNSGAVPNFEDKDFDIEKDIKIVPNPELKISYFSWYEITDTIKKGENKGYTDKGSTLALALNPYVIPDAQEPSILPSPGYDFSGSPRNYEHEIFKEFGPLYKDKDGVLKKKYDNGDGTVKYAAIDAPTDLMLGYFTGDPPVNPIDLVERTDQTDPTPGDSTDAPATYAKLIE